MSLPFHVFDFDFQLSASLLEGRRRMADVHTNQTGEVNCICFWFRADAGNETIYTHRGNATTTWKQVRVCDTCDTGTVFRLSRFTVLPFCHSGVSHACVSSLRNRQQRPELTVST